MTTQTIMAPMVLGLRGPVGTATPELVAARDAAVAAVEAATTARDQALATVVKNAACTRIAVQSFYADPEMTGLVGNGWDRAVVARTIIDGRAAVVVTAPYATCGSKLPASLPVGAPFTLAFTLEGVEATDGTAEIYAIYPGGDYSHRLVHTTASVTGPTRYSVTFARQAGQDFVGLYVSPGGASNAITLSQIGAYADASDVERPALNGVEPLLTDDLGEQAAAYEAAAHPNVWPDILTTGATGSGWDAAVPVSITSDGRPYYHVAASQRAITIPLAMVGAPGTPFAMCARIRAAWGGNNSNVIFANFLGTGNAPVDSDQQLADELGPIAQRTIGLWRRFGIAGMIPAGAVALQIYVSALDATSFIDLSLPSIHGGVLPYWRPAATSGGGNGGPALDDVFDYYVSATGSDTNSGASPTAALATIQHALSIAPAGSAIGLNNGDEFRRPAGNVSGLGWVAIDRDDITIGAYGDPNLAAPAIIGSVKRTDFTAVGDGTSSIPYAVSDPQNIWPISLNAPTTISIVSPLGGITKLYYNNRASDRTLQPGEWKYDAAGTHVIFLPRVDPTGSAIEVSPPISAGASQGIQMRGNRQVVRGVSLRFWADCGLAFGFADCQSIDTDDVCCGGDGSDQSYNTVNFLLSGGTSYYPGLVRGGGGGPGDNSSGHTTAQGSSSGLITGRRFIGGCQTGVGNQDGCHITVERCYFEDCYFNLFVYNGGSGGSSGVPGGHIVFRYNISVQRDFTRPHFANNGGNADVVVDIYNNTLVTLPTAIGRDTSAIASDGPTINFKNNIVIAHGVDYIARVKPGTFHSDGNIYFSTDGAPLTSTDSYAITSGPHDIVGVDPKLTSAFVPAFDSPAIRSGIQLGLTRDYAGKAVPLDRPDRGAVQM